MAKAKQMLVMPKHGGLLPPLDDLIDNFIRGVNVAPKIQLSPEFNCSDEFRRDMNAWLLDMFGSEIRTDFPWVSTYVPWGAM